MLPATIKKNKTDVMQLLLENEYLHNQNANYRSYCQDLADFFLPRKAWINSMRMQGERVKFNFLYDTTAISSARDCSAGIYTYLTNPTSRWFGIRFRKADLMKQEDTRMFCKDVEDWAFAKLDDSNFYNIVLEWFADQIIFGPGTFGMFEDAEKFVRFNNVPVGRVNRVVDAFGRLTDIYINFPLTAHQAFKLFGPSAGESVLKSLQNEKPFAEFDFVHYVGKRYDIEAGKSDSMNMPYKSCWIAKKDKHMITENGFMEMPYISEVFYQDSNDPNGFSPAMDCFAEVKLVNAMKRTVIRGAMKQSDPAYIMPSRGFVLPLNANPGAMNYRDAKTPHDALQALPVGNGRIDIGVDLIKHEQEIIQNAMFVNLFRSLNEVTKQMTVLETQQRVSQSMSLLGPVVNRMTRALGLTINRLVSMGPRDPLSGFPKIPKGLEHEEYDIEYLSILAKAQRQTEVSEIQSFLMDVETIGAVMPAVIDKIDEDKTIDVLHRIRGITPEILRGEEEVAQIRKHREEQKQLMIALQGGQAVADIAKTGADAHKSASQSELVGAK